MHSLNEDTKWQPTQTTATATPATKPLRPLTRKQKAFVQHIVNNPKQSATQAVLATYNVDNPKTAGVVAHENLNKPSIMAELAKYDETAQATLVEVMQYSKDYGRTNSGAKEQGASYASVAARIADSLLDRLHGKATQRIEATSTAVTLNIDLTTGSTEI